MYPLISCDGGRELVGIFVLFVSFVITLSTTTQFFK